MHARNVFKLRPPNFEEIAKKYPDFRKMCFIGAGGKICMDFRDAEAVRLFTQILLLEYFELNVNIPSDALVPRVPQRLNYILLLEDLICKNSFGQIIEGIDIGTGTTCIYPLLGVALNGWKFVATEIDEFATNCAMENVKRNNMGEQIEVVFSKQGTIFKDLFSAESSTGRQFTFCMCNPPFFDYDEATEKFAGDGSALQNYSSMDTDSKRPSPKSTTRLRRGEALFEGGEISFVTQMIEESCTFTDRIRIYTSMVGKRASLRQLQDLLDRKGVRNAVHTLSQGRTHRWILAWTFTDGIKIE